MHGGLMTTDEVLGWLAEVFEAPPEKLEVTSPRSAIPGWDSLGMLSLMASLDEKFNIQLTDKDIGKLQFVSDILNILRQHDLVAGD